MKISRMALGLAITLVIALPLNATADDLNSHEYRGGGAFSEAIWFSSQQDDRGLMLISFKGAGYSEDLNEYLKGTSIRKIPRTDVAFVISCEITCRHELHTDVKLKVSPLDGSSSLELDTSLGRIEVQGEPHGPKTIGTTEGWWQSSNKDHARWLMDMEVAVSAHLEAPGQGVWASTFNGTLDGVSFSGVGSSARHVTSTMHSLMEFDLDPWALLMRYAVLTS